MYVWKHPELKADMLTEDEWMDLETVVGLLKPFEKISTLGQGRGNVFASLSSMLWGFDMLLDLLEKGVEKTRKRKDQSGFLTAKTMHGIN